MGLHRIAFINILEIKNNILDTEIANFNAEITNLDIEITICDSLSHLAFSFYGNLGYDRGMYRSWSFRRRKR